MKYYSLLLLMLLLNITVCAQNEDMDKPNDLPYYQIPDAPATYTAGNVTGRMIDGLGFRYYWATDGLEAKDLDFKPNPDARSTFETIQHIKGLSEVIVNSVTGTPNVRPATNEELTFDQLREITLKNLLEASEILKASSDEDFLKYELVFQSAQQSNNFPFWNQLNGPIADALWHVGQVVSFRRSSGNPLNPKVGVFVGKIRK